MFCGWYGFSKNYYTFLIPLAMFCNFHFAVIPEIENYLKKKYGQQWEQYEKNVKSFIPFIL